MKTTINLTTDSLIALYTIPEQDWIAISKRVGGVLVVASDPGYKNKMPHVFPHFNQVLKSCQEWKDTTFPGLVSQSGALHDYASQAITDFQQVKTEIANLEKDIPSPMDNVKQKVKATIERLQQATIPLNNAFFTLSGQFSEFHDANEQFDTDISTFKEKPIWMEIVFGSIQVLEDAIGQVVGGWQAITSDLEDVVSGKIDITMPFIMELDIDVALKSWKRIQIETDCFRSMANGQQKYLSGDWLRGEKE